MGPTPKAHLYMLNMNGQHRLDRVGARETTRTALVPSQGLCRQPKVVTRTSGCMYVRGVVWTMMHLVSHVGHSLC